MMTRGDSGRVLAVPAELAWEVAVALLTEEVLLLVLLEAVESYEVFRDKAGSDVGGLMDGFCDAASDPFSNGFSPKLNRVLVPVETGLIMAGDMFLRKSR